MQSLGSNYNESIYKRMINRHERRAHYSEINTQATQRFGTLCSPYQALQLLVSTLLFDTMLYMLLSCMQNIEEVRLPCKEPVSTTAALHQMLDS